MSQPSELDLTLRQLLEMAEETDSLVTVAIKKNGVPVRVVAAGAGESAVALAHAVDGIPDEDAEDLAEENGRLRAALQAFLDAEVWPFRNGDADHGQYRGYFDALKAARELVGE